MQLLVDVGNTRLKWARLVQGKLTEHGSAAHRGTLEHALGVLSDALPPDVARVLVANVAGQEIARRLTELARARSGVTPEFVATAAEAFGVRCAYADPSRLGVDRWLGVLAAHRLAAGAACVVGAGTAVTFDAVDAHGAHLGGLIFAGPRLAAAALDAQTSDIGATAPAGARPLGLDLLGKSTDAAVGNGSMLALAAALDRAVAAVNTALGARSKVYLTGGDGPHLRGWLETDAELRADLVLEGLALFAARPLDAARRP
jgi:type III pantothenate kinase